MIKDADKAYVMMSEDEKFLDLFLMTWLMTVKIMRKTLNLLVMKKVVRRIVSNYY